MEKAHAVPGTASFQKFMRVMQVISEQPKVLNVGTLSKVLDLPRPTAYRIVEALMAEGMIINDGDSDRLALGPRLLSLAWQSWESNDLHNIARPYLSKLRDELDETVHLAVRSGLEMMYIDKLESQRTVRMSSRIGTRVSLYSSAVGKAWLAAHSPAETIGVLKQVTIIPHTVSTLIDPVKIKADIALTRAYGFAIDNQENELDICCYGAAIVGTSQKVVGCISVSMPRYRFELLSQEKAIESIKSCVTAIGLNLL